MDLLAVPSQLAIEIRRLDRDVAHHVEAVRFERRRERHKVRVGDELLVILADRRLADHGFLLLRHQDRVFVVKIGERLGVFLVRRGDPLLITILHHRFDLGFVVLRQGRQDGN